MKFFVIFVYFVVDKYYNISVELKFSRALNMVIHLADALTPSSLS